MQGTPLISDGKEIPVTSIIPITGDVSYSAKSLIRVANGGGFRVAAGKTLTVPLMEAGPYNVFNDNGAVAGLRKAIPEWFGAVGDGDTDDTAAVQKAVDALYRTYGGRLVAIDLQWGQYKVSEVVMKPGVGLLNGTIKGSLYIGSDAVAGVQPTNFGNPIFENVAFVQDVLTPGTWAIRYCMAQFAGNVRGCRFTNYDKAIWIPQVTVTIPDQIVHRVTFEDNKFDNCNYFVKTERPTTTNFGIGDIHFINCEGRANISNYRLEGVDGVTITAGTLFMNGHAALDAVKEHNIYMDMVSWAVIDGVKCFESGLEGIYLKRIQHFTICGGSVTWSGQRVPSAGIRIETGDPYGGGRYTCSTISGVTIDCPSLSGIAVDFMMGRLAIHGNVIDRAGDGSYYYGVTDLNTLNHYGIDVDEEAQNVSVFGNVTADNVNNFPATCSTPTNFFGFNLDLSGAAVISPKLSTLSGIETSLSLGGINQVSLNQSDPTTISSYTGGVVGQDLLITAYNGNTTLNDTSVFKLRGRVPTKPPAGGVIFMRYIIDCWREVARNYPDTPVVATLSGTETAVTGTLLSQVNLNQASATTITTFPTGFEGQEILCAAFNGNTTIQNNAGVYLKGGANAVMLINYTLRLRWIASKWVEVSRNF